METIRGKYTKTGIQTKGRMFLDPRRDDNEEREVEASLYDSLLGLLTAWLDKSALRTRS